MGFITNNNQILYFQHLAPGSQLATSDTIPIEFYLGSNFIMIQISLIYYGIVSPLYATGTDLFIEPPDILGNPWSYHNLQTDMVPGNVYFFNQKNQIGNNPDAWSTLSPWSFRTSAPPISLPVIPDGFMVFQMAGYYLRNFF